MEYGAWLAWQIDYLLLLQNFRDVSHHVFDNFFLGITTFGEVMIPISVCCALYWVVNKKVGQFVLWSYLFGFIANQLAKVTACIYRPWILDTRVHPLAQAIPAATGYSFPSGHTAGAVTIWGGTALSFWKNKFVRYICLVILICVMFSRNYVGVHTPQDVVVSFLLSCFMLYVAHKAIQWCDEDNRRDKYILGIVFAVITFTTLYVVFKNYPCHYLFGKLLYDPTPVKIDTIARVGFVFGAFSGWFIEKRCIDFRPENGIFSQKVARMLLGMTMLYGLYSCVGFFREMICSNIILGLSGLFIQHYIIGIFITCIYPYIFKRFNI